jgi:hypothetical protein
MRKSHHVFSPNISSNCGTFYADSMNDEEQNPAQLPPRITEVGQRAAQRLLAEWAVRILQARRTKLTPAKREDPDNDDVG